MDARFYNSEDIDVERLAIDLVNAYQAQGYKAQYIGDRNQMLVQLKKGGDFEAILGMQAALSLSIQRTSGGVLAMIGKQRWIDKAAVGAIGIAAIAILWPLAVTAGVGAFRQASLANQALNMVDGLVRQQRPDLVGGPVPPNLLPQMQQQWAPLPAPSKGTSAPPQPVAPEPMYVPPPARVVNSLPAAPVSSRYRCPNCNTPHEPGDTFCSGCGRPLTAAKVYCSNCNNELKAGASFCPRCGATTFSAVSKAQNAQPAPQPVPTPAQPTITYVAPAPQPPTYTPPTQPAQPTPVYTPPPQPVRSETPVYTPPPTPPKPETPVYTPPRQPETPVYTPPPTPPKPVQPVYTPPTPKKPDNPPTPQVYYVPSQPTQSEPPTVSSPSKPTEPYYVPPVTQEPTIKPQPKVTIVPGTPKQEPPPPQKPRPQKQYYIPSNQAQPTVTENQPTQHDTHSSSQVQGMTQTETVTAQPEGEAKAGTSPTPTWGLLIFNDGQEIQLKGERALVGRYDHDMGGLQPDVDLGKMQGADTVSRVHATLEHIGSSYMVTDLNSTNATRINGKRLEPDKPTATTDGDTLQFGKITCTFKKA
jgi:hypothetical protein